MLTTDARLAANRANAQHSTGPKTPEGKAAVAQNSATLGLFCSRDLVRPEEQSEYGELRASLESDLRPATAMERTHALEILHATWRLRRCALVEADLLAPTLESGLDPMEQATATTQAAVTQTRVDRARAHARNKLRLASQHISRLQTERQLRAQLNAGAVPQPEGLVNSPEPAASNPSFGAPRPVAEGRGPVKIQHLLQSKPILSANRPPHLTHPKKPGDSFFQLFSFPFKSMKIKPHNHQNTLP